MTAISALALIIAILPSADVGAQDPTPATAVTPIATPFVGSYPVWCTSGNPAPNNLCGSHHRTPAIDVGMGIGVEIRAAGDGTVVEVESGCGTSWCRGGAGNFVSIGHADGTISRYLHLSSTAVAAGDAVVTGQLIGLAGDTGQLTNPHLHYDEHYPAGRRTPFGEWLACVSGEVVRYPDAFGVTSWHEVPFGSVIVNEGYECLTGVELVPEPPLVYGGDGQVAVTMSTTRFGTRSEVEITTTQGGTIALATRSVRPDRLIRLGTTSDATYSFRLRTRIGSTWTAWSEAVVYVPETGRTDPTCTGLFATVSGSTGTAGIDVLVGTDGADTLDGRGGNDVVCGLGGDDRLIGGDGDDRLEGGSGHDTLSGGDGRDRLVGGPGHDEIDAGAGRDRASGGVGTDDVAGGAGADVLIGGGGPDVLRGEGGNDRVHGGAGDDLVRGGGGHDRLFGNDGVDVIDGGVGVDLCAHDEGDGSITQRCES